MKTYLDWTWQEFADPAKKHCILEQDIRVRIEGSTYFIDCLFLDTDKYSKSGGLIREDFHIKLPDHLYPLCKKFLEEDQEFQMRYFQED